MDVTWNGEPVGKLTAAKTQKPSQNFVEGVFDARTSYKPFLLNHAEPLSPHNLHLAFRRVHRSAQGWSAPAQARGWRFELSAFRAGLIQKLSLTSWSSRVYITRHQVKPSFGQQQLPFGPSYRVFLALGARMRVTCLFSTVVGQQPCSRPSRLAFHIS